MVSKVIDTLITFRILRLLTKKWPQQKAYKLGIIDNKGKPLKKSADLTTTQEKNSYTLLHRLVFNLKRLIEKVPFGKHQITSYLAALALIKEHVEEKASSFTSNRLIEAIEDRFDVPSFNMNESHFTFDMSSKEGYLAAVEEELMKVKEQTSIAGAVAGGTPGIGNSSVPDTIVVPKKNDKKRANPLLQFLKR